MNINKQLLACITLGLNQSSVFPVYEMSLSQATMQCTVGDYQKPENVWMTKIYHMSNSR